MRANSMKLLIDLGANAWNQSWAVPRKVIANTLHIKALSPSGMFSTHQHDDQHIHVLLITCWFMHDLLGTSQVVCRCGTMRMASSLGHGVVR